MVARFVGVVTLLWLLGLLRLLSWLYVVARFIMVAMLVMILYFFTDRSRLTQLTFARAIVSLQTHGPISL